jgi:hypothetical protein
MKTAMGMEKAKVWISENLGTKLATRLFRGLALGVLLAAGTGIYFSINQGEAGSPLASEQGACYPLYPELGPCVSEWIAVAPTIVDRYDRGLFDEVLPEDLKQGTAGSPLASAEIEYWPEAGFDSYTYHRFMVEQGKKVYAQINFLEEWLYTAIPPISSTGVTATIADPLAGDGFDALPDPALAAGSPLASEQFEYWPEVSSDSYIYHRFMSEQGKVGRVLSGAVAEIDDVEAMAIYGYPASILHALNQG